MALQNLGMQQRGEKGSRYVRYLWRSLDRSGAACVRRAPQGDDEPASSTAALMTAGEYRDNHAALGFRRLAIIDVAGGHQPLSNEDGSDLDGFQRRDL